MSHLDLISDHSKEKLTEVPRKLLDMTNLKMLFLEGNFLYELPADIFWKLPKLMWLDLRNNQLETIPKSIAYHEHLENLLLTNNNIKLLPNELGLLSKLKALQVSENPLVYPAKKIIVEGTKAIKNYLKRQYEKVNRPLEDLEKTVDGKCEAEEEEIINVVNESTSEEIIDLNEEYTKPKKKKNQQKALIQQLNKNLTDPHVLQPTLQVKKLSQTTSSCRKHEEPLKIVHKINREGSKIYLKSYFNKLGVRSSTNKISDSGLREGWLNQLRILLTDQERILQQERNLKALSDWRAKKRTETPKTFYDSDVNKSDPPYATYPEYSKMPTREELASQLHVFFKERGLTKPGGERGHNMNIDKLINDLVQQLKEMENTYSETRSPRSEIDRAGKQIKTIMDIHKKLLRLKTSNDSSI